MLSHCIYNADDFNISKRAPRKKTNTKTIFPPFVTAIRRRIAEQINFYGFPDSGTDIVFIFPHICPFHFLPLNSCVCICINNKKRPSAHIILSKDKRVSMRPSFFLIAPYSSIMSRVWCTTHVLFVRRIILLRIINVVGWHFIAKMKVTHWRNVFFGVMFVRFE